MTLFELLTIMQDVNVDLHLYKNYTHNEDNQDKKCEEVYNVEGTNNDVFLTLCNKGYPLALIKVFYIGYLSSRSKVLRVNAEVEEI